MNLLISCQKVGSGLLSHHLPRVPYISLLYHISIVGPMNTGHQHHHHQSSVIRRGEPGFWWVLTIYVGEGNGTPPQYSCLENPMDGGAWWAEVQGVAKSWTRLSDFIFTFHFHPLEKEMATHSSGLAWRIPGTGETGGLPSMGSHRVGHDWSDLAAAAAAATLYLCVWVCVCERGRERERVWTYIFSVCNYIFYMYLLEKEMATHSSILAWRIPGTGEPGGLLSMESHRVGHDWSDLAAYVLVF